VLDQAFALALHAGSRVFETPRYGVELVGVAVHGVPSGPQRVTRRKALGWNRAVVGGDGTEAEEDDESSEQFRAHEAILTHAVASAWKLQRKGACARS
jgi:hypothetical protein